MGVKKFPAPVLIGALSILLTACEQERPAEVYVPPTGDPERGREVFVEFKCYTCHTIPDVDLPERDAEPPMVLALGVRMHRVRRYGDLLTAVLYPGHAVSQKFIGAVKAAGEDPSAVRMPDYAEEMTVSELVDLVEFLDTEYSRLMGSQYQGKGQ